LLSKDAIGEVVEILRGRDFYRPAHELIFEVIIDLYGRGEPADPVTVAADLTKRGEIARAGGAPYLHTLISSVPTAANASYYARIVADHAIMRRLVEAGTKIVQLGYSKEGDVDDVVDSAQAEIYSVTEHRTSEDYIQLSELQKNYIDEATRLWNDSLHANPSLKDRRFSGEAWSHNPIAAYTAAAYLLNARTLMGLADAVDADAKTRARIQFAVEQWVAASAPSNFLAFNAEAQKKAIDTQGESISKGIQNLMHDMRQGHVSMTDESLFEVGKNVATTEG